MERQGNATTNDVTTAILLTIRAAERVKSQNAETEIPIGVFKAMRSEEFGKLMVMVFTISFANSIGKDNCSEGGY